MLPPDRLRRDPTERDVQIEILFCGIVRRSLEVPIKQIARNAGVEGSIVVQTVKDAKTASFGFNAATCQHEDMVKAALSTRPRS